MNACDNLIALRFGVQLKKKKHEFEREIKFNLFFFFVIQLMITAICFIFLHPPIYECLKLLETSFCVLWKPCNRTEPTEVRFLL